MALNKVKTKPNPQTGLYDLNTIGDMLVDQSAKVVERQEAEHSAQQQRVILTQSARKEALTINDRARAQSEVTRNEQLDILSGVHSQLDKAKTAMRLADSDNPLDRISLWFLQQQDSGYTREGNTARIQYLQSAAGALGDINVIQQQGFAEEIQRTQELLDMQLAENDDRLALIKLNELQGQELIDAEIQAQNTRLGIIQNQNNMQANALSNATDDQVAVALQQAAQSSTQSTSLGGVEISLARLQQRQREIKELRYNESVMNLNIADMTLANLTMPELIQAEKDATASKKRVVEIKGVEVPLGRISDRIYTMNNQEVSEMQGKYAVSQTQQAVIQQAQQKALDSMLMPQLEAIIQNGFIDPNTNIRYDSQMVRNARDLKADDTVKQVQQEAMVQSMANPVSPATQVQQQIDAVLPNLTPGSAAANAMDSSKHSLAYAANLLNSGDPIRIEQGHRIVAATQENVNAQIDAEAARLSAGDESVARAYSFVLRGQQIPPDLIAEELTRRVKKGEDAGTWLTGEQNAIFVSTYRAEKARLLMDVSGPVQMSTEDAESRAAEVAITAVLNQIAAPVSDTLLMMQANPAAAPTNPIGRVMTQTEFASLLKAADTAGMESYISGSQADQATKEQIRSGAMVPPELETAQNAELYRLLEQKRPGLGDQYAAWWASNEPQLMAERYVASQMQTAQGDFKKMAQLSLIMPHIPASLGSYAYKYNDGKRDVFQERLAQEHAAFVTFGANPTTKQVFLLEQTPGLTNQEKQIAMQQIIQPILSMAQAEGITDPAQVAQAVEGQLRNFEPQTPQARTVLGKMLKTRDSALKVANDFVTISSGAINFVLAGGNPVALAARGINDMTNQTNSYGWYTQLQQTGVQPSSIPMNRGMN